MPALAERYTVIAPDLRGYGDSDKTEQGFAIAGVLVALFVIQEADCRKNKLGRSAEEGRSR